MIEEISKNIWEQHKLGYWIVIPTNGTVKRNWEAVMGRGLAAQAKSLYPKLPTELGKKLSTFGNNLFGFEEYKLFTFPVKHEWHQKADPALIKQSCKQLQACVYAYTGKNFWDVYIPRVGCGNGGLTWSFVKSILGSNLNENKFVVCSITEEV